MLTTYITIYGVMIMIEKNQKIIESAGEAAIDVKYSAGKTSDVPLPAGSTDNQFMIYGTVTNFDADAGEMVVTIGKK